MSFIPKLPCNSMSSRSCCVYNRFLGAEDYFFCVSFNNSFGHFKYAFTNSKKSHNLKN